MSSQDDAENSHGSQLFSATNPVPATTMASTLLERHLVDAVVERLTPGLQPSLDVEGLTALYDAWCRNIPFDNLHKRISLENGDSLLPGDDASLFFSNWLDHGVGGTCWAGSNALFALLYSLGFTARRAVATMHLGRGDAPNHGTVIVRLGQRSFLVDTSMLHRRPLPLPEVGSLLPCGNTLGIDVVRHSNPLTLRWQPLHMPQGCLCTLWRRRVSRQRFSRENQLTRRWSPFNFSIHARINRGDATVGIAQGHLLHIAGDGSWTRKPATLEEMRRFLYRELGVSAYFLNQLPPDRPTPPPPKSTTTFPQHPPHKETCR
jgi:N-hydroxyarylamine O-acetyltransferase